MLPHPFKIQKYQQNEPEFNGVYSRNNLLKIRDGKYVIRLDKYRSKGPLWIASYVNDNNVIHFDNFGVEYIPNKTRKFIGNKNVKTNIYIIQAFDLIMCGYFCIGFIDFMLKSESLLEYTNVISTNEYKKNAKIILKSFQQNLNKFK